VAEMQNVTLSAGGTAAFLGEPKSTTGNPACIQSPQRGFADFYSAAKSPALAVVFSSANLGDFVEGFSDPLCTSSSDTVRAQTQGLWIKSAAAYFQWTLQGNARSREYLLGNDFLADAATVALARQSK